MNYGRLPGVEKPVARVVQGTAMIRSEEEEKSFALLDEVFERGGTTFDTAHQYGGGDSERTFGRWVRERDLRDEVVVIGKGAHHNADRKRVTPFDITADLLDSLARFGFDHVDLYLLHRDDPSVPVGPIVEVLNEHLSEGRIKAFGGSNWTPRRLKEANEYARENGLVPFVASSPNLSLAEQAVEPWPDCVSISGGAGEDRAWYERERADAPAHLVEPRRRVLLRTLLARQPPLVRGLPGSAVRGDLLSRSELRAPRPRARWPARGA